MAAPAVAKLNVRTPLLKAYFSLSGDKRIGVRNQILSSPSQALQAELRGLLTDPSLKQEAAELYKAVNASLRVQVKVETPKELAMPESVLTPLDSLKTSLSKIAHSLENLMAEYNGLETMLRPVEQDALAAREAFSKIGLTENSKALDNLVSEIESRREGLYTLSTGIAESTGMLFLSIESGEQAVKPGTPPTAAREGVSLLPEKAEQELSGYEAAMEGIHSCSVAAANNWNGLLNAVASHRNDLEALKVHARKFEYLPAMKITMGSLARHEEDISSAVKSVVEAATKAFEAAQLLTERMKNEANEAKEEEIDVTDEMIEEDAAPTPAAPAPAAPPEKIRAEEDLSRVSSFLLDPSSFTLEAFSEIVSQARPENLANDLIYLRSLAADKGHVSVVIALEGAEDRMEGEELRNYVIGVLNANTPPPVPAESETVEEEFARMEANHRSRTEKYRDDPVLVSMGEDDLLSARFREGGSLTMPELVHYIIGHDQARLAQARPYIVQALKDHELIPAAEAVERTGEESNYLVVILDSIKDAEAHEAYKELITALNEILPPSEDSF